MVGTRRRIFCLGSAKVKFSLAGERNGAQGEAFAIVAEKERQFGVKWRSYIYAAHGCFAPSKVGPMLKSELRPKTLKQAIAAGLRNDWNGHERTVLGKELTPTLTVVRDG